MKTKTVIQAGALATIMLTSCAQPATNYVLTGAIDGMDDGAVVQLIPMSHDDEQPLAEATVKDGKFRIEGSMEEPRCVRLLAKDTYGSTGFMLENGKISITGKAERSFASDSTLVYTYDVHVKGSPSTDTYLSLVSIRDSLQAVRTDFNERYRDFMQLRGKAYVEKNQALMDSLDHTPTAEAMRKEDNDFFHLVETSYNRVVLAHKDSFWGPLLLLDLTAYLTPAQKEIYQQFSPEVQQSHYGRLVADELYPAGAVGQPVKSFSVKGADGEDIALSALLEGKKYVLIDFWASWCNPCRKEIPNLKKLYQQYAPQGFEIVSISIDKKEADWKKALEEEQLQWPNFIDQTGVAALYKVRSVPSMYLIDAKGVLVEENLRGEALAKKLEELFP